MRSLILTFTLAIFTSCNNAFDVDLTGSIGFERDEVLLLYDQTEKLPLTFSNEILKNNSYQWYSDNENIAIVENGEVTGLLPGTTTITVEDPDHDMQAQCQVDVRIFYDPVAEFGISLEEIIEKEQRKYLGETLESTPGNIQTGYLNNLNNFYLFENENESVKQVIYRVDDDGLGMVLICLQNTDKFPNLYQTLVDFATNKYEYLYTESNQTSYFRVSRDMFITIDKNNLIFDGLLFAYCKR